MRDTPISRGSVGFGKGRERWLDTVIDPVDQVRRRCVMPAGLQEEDTYAKSMLRRLRRPSQLTATPPKPAQPWKTWKVPSVVTRAPATSCQFGAPYTQGGAFVTCASREGRAFSLLGIDECILGRLSPSVPGMQGRATVPGAGRCTGSCLHGEQRLSSASLQQFQTGSRSSDSTARGRSDHPPACSLRSARGTRR